MHFLKFDFDNFISRLDKPTTSNSAVSRSFSTIPRPIPLEAPVTTAIVP